jgi:hypothetical protein
VTGPSPCLTVCGLAPGGESAFQGPFVVARERGIVEAAILYEANEANEPLQVVDVEQDGSKAARSGPA